MIDNELLNRLLLDGWDYTKPVNPKFTCKCGSNEIIWKLWESSDGAYEDYHYRCMECDHDWWVESSDY